MNVRVWASRNPRETFDRLQSLPEGLVDPAHYQVLWESWTRPDPEEASAILLGMPPGAHRDGAIQGLLAQIALGSRVVIPDFEAAWQWAGDLTDPQLRRNLMEEVASHWRKTDPEAASKALD